MPGAPGITANIFNDIRLVANDHPNALSFSLGAIDFFVQGHINDKFSAVLETTAEFGDDNEPSVDVERIQLSYLYNDHLRITAGRIHAPFGYYNTAFHHGAWMQTTVGRARVVNFEDDGGLLPVHSVGLEARGVFAKKNLELGYAVNLANGRGERPDEVTQSFDHNVMKAVNVLAYVQHKPSGLRVGGNVYVDRIPATSDPVAHPDRTTSIGERILGAHLVWLHDDAEVIAEYYQLRHDLPGATAVHHGAFAVLSYGFGDYRPYVRVQTIRMDKAHPDPFFDPAVYANQDGLAVGLKIWLADLVAFKLEYEREINDGTPSRDLGTAQVAYGF